jgi:hypothetical protein
MLIVVVMALALVPDVTVAQPAPAATPAAASQPAATPATAAPVVQPTPETKAPEKATEAPAAAPKKTAETQAWWQAVLVFVIDLSKALIVPILIVLGIAANKKWKLGLEIETLEWIANKSVGYGEQLAKKALKDGEPMAGPKILDTSLSYGRDLLITKGLAGTWGNKLAGLIEAKLGEQELAKKEATPKTAEGQPKSEAEKPDTNEG